MPDFTEKWRTILINTKFVGKRRRTHRGEIDETTFERV